MSKKIPLRMCIACRTMKEKNELLRIVKNKQGEIFIDKSFKANGRGAYICNNGNCFDKCIKSKSLNRAFKCEIPVELLEELKQNMNN